MEGWKRAFEKNAGLLALTLFVVVLGAVLWPEKAESTPPQPRWESSPRVEEPPLKLAPIVTECWIRLSHEEIQKLADSCSFEWQGDPWAFKDEVRCYPRSPSRDFSDVDPIWSVDVADYKGIKPGVTWRK